ncbi:MAG: hypothetical protein Q8S73_42000 [Deltaproteobacteria bacterium]|nr:hypothetical protein [Deltaproteobacteria bacterium]
MGSTRRTRSVLLVALSAALSCAPGSNAPAGGASTGGVVQLAVGFSTSCALRGDHSIACWGQLGSALSSTGTDDVAQIAVGWTHVCARTRAGGVTCRGANTNGQLGTGAPTGLGVSSGAVLGLTDAVDVAAGDLTSCAVRRGGRVVCWGDGSSGQLGDGRSPDSLQPCPLGVKRGYCSIAPVEVAGLSDAVAVATNAQGSCARRANGRVSCWGFGTPTVAEVPGVADATEVTMARGSAAIVRADGSLWRGTPALGVAVVAGLAGVRSAALGDLSSCVLLRTGAVQCWGRDNVHGQLGDGTTEVSGAPVFARGIYDAVEIGTGQWNTCVRRMDGSAWCWGANFDGQAGRPCADRSNCDVIVPSPVLVP